MTDQPAAERKFHVRTALTHGNYLTRGLRTTASLWPSQALCPVRGGCVRPEVEYGRLPSARVDIFRLRAERVFPARSRSTSDGGQPAPRQGADRPFTTPKRRRGALLAVSVRIRSLKPLPPMMSVAVGEQGSTIALALAGEFALAQEQAVARAGSQPATRWSSCLPRSLSARSRLDCSSLGSSARARIAARSWCSSPPAGWLTGLLLLALASIRPRAAFGALLVSLAAALALFTPRPSAVAGKLAGQRAGSSGLLIGAASRHVLRAVASRASAGREHPRTRPIAR